MPTLLLFVALAITITLVTSGLMAGGGVALVASWNSSSTPSSLAASGAPTPPAPLVTTPQILGSIVHQDVGLPAAGPNTSFAFIFAENANGYSYDVGYKTFHMNGDTGTYNFTDDLFVPNSYPVNFPKIVAMLANGIDDSIGIASADDNGSATSTVVMESTAFGTSPDFLGNRIDNVALVMHDLHIYSIGGSSFEFANYTWQIWGHPFVLVLAPPTDADGAFVFDRNSEAVNADLSSTPDSAPLLNWDGNNMTMQGSGTRWHLTVSNVPNGAHSLKVWATVGGKVYASEGLTGRHITFGYRLWSQITIAPGMGPGIALDANGTAHICYQDTSGGIIYSVRSGSTWISQTVATGASGGACGIALDREGRPHLLFGKLQHAFLSGGTWAIDTISTNGIANNASIALNPVTDLPTVAWYHTLNHYLVVSNDTTSGWQSSIADRAGTTGFQPSLVVDGNGIPNVAYFDSLGTPIYVNISPAQHKWDREPITSPVAPAPGNGRISLALNATGRPHVVFAGGGPLWGTVGYRGIFYAYWPKGAGSFTVFTVPTPDSTTHAFVQGPVQAVSIAIDPSNHPRIGFSLVGTPPPTSGLLTDLGYGSFDGASWNISFLSHVVGSGSLALALTPWGGPEIVTSLTAGPSGSGLYWFASNAADREAPVTTAALSGTLGQNGFYTSSVTVTLTATDDINGVASTSYSVDNGSWTTYASPFLVSSDGAHSVRYSSTDNVGNIETTKTISFTMDLGGPTTSAALAGTAGLLGWYVSPVQVTLSAGGGTSGVASVHFRVDNGTWQTYSAPFPVGEGVHSVDYYAVSNAGTNGATSTSYINVDTSTPSVTAQLSGTGSGGWYRSSVTLNLTATDALSGPASISVSVNGGTWTTTSGSSVTQTFSAEGVTNVSYYATDRAGIAGTHVTVPLKIDTSAPSTTSQVLATSGLNGWYTSDASVALAAADSLSGVASIQYRVDGGSWQTYAGTIAVHDGAHTIEYYALDVAGNAEAVLSLQLRVDSTPPQIGITSPIGVLTTSQVTVSWTGSDATSGIGGYAISVDGQGFTTVGNTTHATVGLLDGDHTITIRATDLAGNSAETQTHVTVNTNALSPYGPYGAVPLVALGVLVLAVIAFLVVILLYWRRGKKGHAEPREPKSEPPA
jgi:hypothetical protein